MKENSVSSTGTPPSAVAGVVKRVYGYLPKLRQCLNCGTKFLRNLTVCPNCGTRYKIFECTTSVERILHSLYEAKSYKNHIKKSVKQELEKYIWKNLQRLEQFRIKDVDSLIDFVEMVLKNFGVVHYTWWIVENLLDTTDQLPLFITSLGIYGEALKKFESFKKRKLLTGSESKLGHYSDPEELIRVLNSIQDPRDGDRLIKKGEAEIEHKTSRITVIRVHTSEAADFFGSGVRGRSNPWCIRYDSYFDEYKREGYEWRIVQVPGERYAIDFTKMEGWDKNNQKLRHEEIRKLEAKYPELKKVVPESQMFGVPLSKRPITYQISAILNEPAIMNDVDDPPSEKAVLEALTGNPAFIEFILKPTDTQLVHAAKSMFEKVKSNPLNTGRLLLDYDLYLDFVRNYIGQSPSMQIKKKIPPTKFTDLRAHYQMAAIRYNRKFLQLAVDESVKICAVEEDPLLIAYISEPSFTVLVKAAESFYRNNEMGGYLVFLSVHILPHDSSDRLRRNVPKIDKYKIRPSTLSFYVKEYGHLIDFENDILLER